MIKTQQKGAFITFEGGEGAGKSSLIKEIQNQLTSLYKLSTHVTREPGGSQGAETIRELLVQGDKEKWDRLTEVFLLSAARRDHLAKCIWPKLNQGTWVLCDRFFDSTCVYQGYAPEEDDKVSLSTIHNIGNMIFGNFKPNLTFILDVDPEIGLMRSQKKLSTQKQGQKEDRFETMPLHYHQKVRAAFLDIAHKEPERCRVIDASQAPEEIFIETMQHITNFFSLSEKQNMS